jgi:hypothetical protein
LDDTIREPPTREQQRQAVIPNQMQDNHSISSDMSSRGVNPDNFALPPEISSGDPLIQETLLSQAEWDLQRRRQRDL